MPDAELVTPGGVSSGAMRDALLLVAHGSARYPDAGRIALSHLARIGAADPARRVALGLLNGTPSVDQALASLSAPLVRVVPFFMEDGYFTRVAVPKALGSLYRFVMCPPVGVHDGMAGLIADCAHDGCAIRGIPPDRTAVLVVGHGSARAPGRALALHRHTAAVAATGQFAAVRAACLEEPPFIADALRDLRGYPVAVVGFFAGEGGHMRDDVPAAIETEQRQRGPSGWPVHNFGSVADNAGLAQIILDQAMAT